MDLQRLKGEVAELDGQGLFEVVKAWVAAHHDAPDGTLEDLMRSGTAFAARHWGGCRCLTVLGRVGDGEHLQVPIIPRSDASSGASLRPSA